MFSSKRPYLNLRGNEIEVLFENSHDDIAVLRDISEELSHRHRFAMLKLKTLVDEKISDFSSNYKFSSKLNGKESDDLVKEKTKIEVKSHLNCLGNFTSFFDLVKKITRSNKPESLIDSETWKMFINSLRSSDLKYKKLEVTAKSLDLMWPETKKNDEINDYMSFDFDQLKNNYGFEQKKVIISAVAIASYAKVKSWRVLKERYGTKEQPTFGETKKEKTSTVRNTSLKKMVGISVEPSSKNIVNNSSKETIIANLSPYFFNSLLNFKAPWNCIKKTTWDKWRQSINQKQQMLTVADVAKYGQFQYSSALRDINIGELLNFEFRYLDSFTDKVDRRSVFYAVAFLGLGTYPSEESQIPKTNKDKSVSTIAHVQNIDFPAVISTENDTMNDILDDFGL